MQATDTIVALSTPPGRSAIGIIRLSGHDAVRITRALLRDQSFDPEPNRVTLRNLRDPANDRVLDQALLTYFKAPHSFTGEDVVEFSCHGSPSLLLLVIDALLYYGARAADPGEFTLRALSHGRLNLSQAEAIRDLIDAQTRAAVQLAARQLGGELSARLKPVKDSLLDIIVPLESSLEFVEDDLPENVIEHIVLNLSGLVTQLEELAGTFKTGRLLKEGLRVVIVGRPNVGKSTVFNGLLLLERAIVTDIPGTTRDTLSEVLNLEGVPVLLTDTAGMRLSTDKVEQLGIERARQAMIDADLVLVVLDGSQPLMSEDRQVLAEATKYRHLVAVNKSDLGPFDSLSASFETQDAPVFSISAKTGEGLDLLRASLIEPFKSHDLQESNFIITNARHYDLLSRTIDSLHSSERLLTQGASEEVILVGLYDSLRFLGEITGETTPEDVLSQIFSTFCIGK